MFGDKKYKVAEIKVWIDPDLKKQFKDFSESMNISLTDFIKVSGSYFINVFKKNNPLTLNLFTTDLKNAIKSKRIKIMWDFPKDKGSDN